MITRKTALELYRSSQTEEIGAELVQMERNGFALDVGYCTRRAKEAEEDAEDLEHELDKWVFSTGANPVNWASPKQLAEFLHDHLALPPSPVWKLGRVKLKQGERKTDETAIEWIRNSEATVGREDIRGGLEKLIKLRRTRSAIKYLTKLPLHVAPDGLVHPVSGPASDFDPRAGTITWRLACKNPEVLQIPTDPRRDLYEIRRAFVAPEGYQLVCADETALEAVIFAHLLITLFDDHLLADLLGPGKDLHAYNAKKVFGEFLGWERYGHRVDYFPDSCFKDEETYPELARLRNDIKAVWYGLMYGKSDYGFATSLRDIHDQPIGIELASKIVHGFHEALPGLPRYQAWVGDYLAAHHGIPGLGGAWCDLSELTKTGNKWDLAHANRIAQNYPMQEGGARIIGRAMVELGRGKNPRFWESGVRLERQVHDELDFRVPLRADMAMVSEEIRKAMTAYQLRAPLQVKIGVGATWHDAKN